MVLELNEADLNMYEDKIKSKRDVRMYVKIKRDQKSPCFVCGKGILSIYLTFFSLLTKRQTHITTKTTVASYKYQCHTGIGQTDALYKLKSLIKCVYTEYREYCECKCIKQSVRSLAL